MKLKVYAPSCNTAIPEIMTHMIIEEYKDKDLYDYFYKDFIKVWNKAKNSDDINLDLEND